MQLELKEDDLAQLLFGKKCLDPLLLIVQVLRKKLSFSNSWTDVYVTCSEFLSMQNSSLDEPSLCA